VSKHWQEGDEFGADILGFGCFQFIHGGSGKSKSKTQIGFVRDGKCTTARAKNPKDVSRKSRIPNKGRSQATKARCK
jgi:hypothetical protein